MSEMKHGVGIVLLNWNGWRDTIECLESLYRLDNSDFFVVIVDNGSTNDSVPRITEWVEGYRAEGAGAGIPLTVLEHDGKSSTLALTAECEKDLRTCGASQSHAIFLVRSAENLGFAAGCNLGMRLSLAVGCEYTWLLNNDTVVVPDSLRKLVEFLEEHKDYAGATGQIRYHGKPDVIWNCGGNLLPFGLRRYDYCGTAASLVPSEGHKRISYITGCAFLLRAQLMQQIGFLTEKFFFGEEDFEFCHRLKRQGQPLACRYDAVIYHKVGASVSAAAATGVLAKAHVHYLNRFIHMRRYWSTAFWQCWRHAYCLYVMWLLNRSWGIPYRQSLPMLRSVLSESSRLDEVDRETFGYVMRKAYDA